MIEKKFSKNGGLKIRFAADAKEQIQEWLGDIDYDDAIKFASLHYEDPIFGDTVEFPCASYSID